MRYIILDFSVKLGPQGGCEERTQGSVSAATSHPPAPKHPCACPSGSSNGQKTALLSFAPYTELEKLLVGSSLPLTVGRAGVLLHVQQQRSELFFGEKVLVT